MAISEAIAADMQFVTKGQGQFQLPGGTWESNYLMLTNQGVTVGKGKQAREIALRDFGHAVLHRDTFAVVHDVYFQPQGKKHEQVPLTTVLGRRVWRHPQVEVLEFASSGGAMPLLRFANHQSLALPLKRKEFQQVMLSVVGDHPGLANQLKAGQLDVTHLRAVLELYLRTKPEGFDPAAIFAAQPSVEAKE